MPSKPIAALTAALVLAVAAPVAAAPAGFYGMNWDREIARAGDDVLTREWGEMGSAGVESVRTVFSWSEAQPAEGAPFDFSHTDPVVAEAARRQLSLLPVILTTPQWAKKYPRRLGSPPESPKQPTRYLTALMDRYGSQGTFWLENPLLPKRPLMDWQMWNEPELTTYWDEKRFWKGYAKLVRTSYAALKRVDAQARLVLAGSVGFSWESLDRLYRQGIKKHFDVAAIHPYTGSPDEVAEIVRRNRRVLRRWGERKKPVWITELSWPASQGRMKPPSGLRRVVTDDQGMAKRLRMAYRYFAHPKDPRHKVGRVYWYTWASRYTGKDDVFDYAGLLRFRDGEVSRNPAWTAYRGVAL